MAENVTMEIINSEQFKRANIRFTGKPSEEIRNELKKEGWIYSRNHNVWYPKNTAAENSQNFANHIKETYFPDPVEPEVTIITENSIKDELIVLIQNGAPLEEVIAKLDEIYGEDAVQEAFSKAIENISQEELNKGFLDTFNSNALEIAIQNKINGDYIHIQQDDEYGWDYTSYTKDYREIDGGVGDDVPSTKEKEDIREVAKIIIKNLYPESNLSDWEATNWAVLQAKVEAVEAERYDEAIKNVQKSWEEHDNGVEQARDEAESREMNEEIARLDSEAEDMERANGLREMEAEFPFNTTDGNIYPDEVNNAKAKFGDIIRESFLTLTDEEKENGSSIEGKAKRYNTWFKPMVDEIMDSIIKGDSEIINKITEFDLTKANHVKENKWYSPEEAYYRDVQYHFLPELYNTIQEKIKKQYEEEKIPYVVMFSSESPIFPSENKVYTVKEFNDLLSKADSDFHNRKKYAEEKYGSPDNYWDLERDDKLPEEDKGIQFGYDKTNFKFFNIPNPNNPEDTFSYEPSRYDIGDGNGSVFDYVRATCSHDEFIEALNELERNIYFSGINSEAKLFVRNAISKESNVLKTNLTEKMEALNKAQEEYKELHKRWLIEASEAERVDEKLKVALDEIKETYDSSIKNIYTTVLNEYPFEAGNVSESEFLKFTANEVKSMVVSELFLPSRDAQKAMNAEDYKAYNSVDWAKLRRIWEKFPAPVNMTSYVESILQDSCNEKGISVQKKENTISNEQVFAWNVEIDSNDWLRVRTVLTNEMVNKLHLENTEPSVRKYTAVVDFNSQGKLQYFVMQSEYLDGTVISDDLNISIETASEELGINIFEDAKRFAQTQTLEDFKFIENNSPFSYTNEILGKIRAAGIEVVTDKDEFDRILGKEELIQKMANTETNPLFLADENELKAFAQKIDDWKAGNLSSNEIITEFSTSTVLQAINIPANKIAITQERLEKINAPETQKIGNSHGHDIDIETIKQIPSFLADPIMVFTSTTRTDSFTVMTEAVDKNNETILVALQISKNQGSIIVNEITSAYGKDENEWFIEQIKLGNLVYENKQKSLEWSHRRGLLLPTRMSTQGSLNVIRKEDIVNKRTQNFALSERNIEFTENQQEFFKEIGFTNSVDSDGNSINFSFEKKDSKNNKNIFIKKYLNSYNIGEYSCSVIENDRLVYEIKEDEVTHFNPSEIFLLRASSMDMKDNFIIPVETLGKIFSDSTLQVSPGFISSNYSQINRMDYYDILKSTSFKNKVSNLPAKFISEDIYSANLTTGKVLTFVLHDNLMESVGFNRSSSKEHFLLEIQTDNNYNKIPNKDYPRLYKTKWDRASKAYIDKTEIPLSDLDSKTISNIQYIAANNCNTELAKPVQSMTLGDGSVYGFVHNGKIYLNPEIINSNAAVHEYTHLWDAYTQKTNPELWNKGLEIFKDTKYWNEVISDPNYQDIKDDENLVLSEIHARIQGDIAEQVLNRIAELDGDNLKLDAIDWDQEVMEFISSSLDLPVELKNSEELKNFLKMPLKDLVDEKNISVPISLNYEEFTEKNFERFVQGYNTSLAVGRDGDGEWYGRIKSGKVHTDIHIRDNGIALEHYYPKDDSLYGEYNGVNGSFAYECYPGFLLREEALKDIDITNCSYEEFISFISKECIDSMRDNEEVFEAAKGPLVSWEDYATEKARLSKIIVFDTETTGITPGQDELLQVSIIDGNGKTLFNNYVKPEHTTEWQNAQAINGISPETVKDAASIKEYIPELQKIFDNADVLVSYNGIFDVGFLEAAGIKIGSNKPHLDVMKAFAPVFGEKTDHPRSIDGYKYKKLSDAGAYYNLDYKAHDSLGDTTATLEVAKRIYGNSLERLTKAEMEKYSANSVNERKPYNFFVNDTANLDLGIGAEFDPVTRLTAEKAALKYAELKDKGFSPYIGLNIPGDFIFDNSFYQDLDPHPVEPSGCAIFTETEGKPSFYIGDNFVKNLKENDEHAKNVISAYKELYENVNKYILGVERPSFVFEKEEELLNETPYIYCVQAAKDKGMNLEWGNSEKEYFKSAKEALKRLQERNKELINGSEGFYGISVIIPGDKNYSENSKPEVCRYSLSKTDPYQLNLKNIDEIELEKNNSNYIKAVNELVDEAVVIGFKLQTDALYDHIRNGLKITDEKFYSIKDEYPNGIDYDAILKHVYLKRLSEIDSELWEEFSKVKGSRDYIELHAFNRTLTDEQLNGYINEFENSIQNKNWESIYRITSILKRYNYESEVKLLNNYKFEECRQTFQKKPLKVYTFSPFGFEGSIIEVETDMRPGIQAYDIVGLADSAVKESRERIWAALRNSGIGIPSERILQSLSPADIKKDSPLDLSMALGIMSQTTQYPVNESVLALGELELSGKIRPVRGARAAVTSAKSYGITNVICDPVTAELIKDIEGINILTAEDLNEVNEKLLNPESFEMNVPAIENTEEVKFNEEYLEDYKEALENLPMEGHFETVRAIQIAVAGKHNILATGAPGCGKTLLTQTLMPVLTPKLTKDEAQSIARINSLAGLDSPKRDNLIPPFRMPHQTATIEGICGGGPNCRPGEISLAHQGTLFMDEAAEFRTSVIQMLRVPLESKSITLSRAGRSTVYPAGFQLAMAMNPCPCGNFHSDGKICLDSARSIEQYWKKISDPLLDRIEIKTFVQKDENDKRKMSIDELKKQIATAYEIQRKRGVYNNQMTPEQIQQYCKLDEESQEFLNKREDLFTPRGRANLLKLSLTIANMDGREEIHINDIKEAHELSAPVFEKPNKFVYIPEENKKTISEEVSHTQISQGELDLEPFDDKFLTSDDVIAAKNEKDRIVQPILNGEKSGMWKAFEDFDEHGVFDIRGKELALTKTNRISETGYKQLQAAMNIYRDKRFETFRYVLVDRHTGEITDQLAISSHLPNVCAISDKGDDTLKKIISRAEEKDCLVVAVHNHPSGNTKESTYDVETTDSLRKSLKRSDGLERFAGHIILDHDSFNLYTPRKGWHTVESINQKEDKLEKKNNPEWTKSEIDSATSLISLAKTLNDTYNWNDDFIPVVFTNADNKISGVQYYHKDYFAKDPDIIREDFQFEAMGVGAVSAFPVVTEHLMNKLIPEDRSKLVSTMKALVEDNVITDCALSDSTVSEKFSIPAGKSYYESFIKKEDRKNDIQSTWDAKVDPHLFPSASSNDPQDVGESIRNLKTTNSELEKKLVVAEKTIVLQQEEIKKQQYIRTKDVTITLPVRDENNSLVKNQDGTTKKIKIHCPKGIEAKLSQMAFQIEELQKENTRLKNLYQSKSVRPKFEDAGQDIN
ncbi:MAG: YifB family Mg chelatase-like AAA ATPase [Treponema sp.]|uniref:YifB family Mg chelatase-like AAA ATPase n=1 Tax=Treponema sp. TaxID=166 RepID=UPI00298EB968|nr:YifB family Mg chelatase-like AAA ATPase [Treponema sp.]MCQ2600909.1 YifB family Mg chelatase-like AAA ATPase [Treponema sp.]